MIITAGLCRTKDMKKILIFRYDFPTNSIAI